MKKLLRKLVISTMVCVSIVTPTSLSVSAGHALGCGSQTSYIKCGSIIARTSGSHILHTNVSCAKTGYLAQHNRACTYCDGDLGNVGGRVCSWTHQYCPKENGVCQY